MGGVEALAAALEDLHIGGRLGRNVSLAPHTSYGIGGPADLLLEAERMEEIVVGIRLARQAGVPARVLGGASNVLVADAGVRGLVLLNRCQGFELDEGTGELRARSGMALRELARWSTDAGWAGLEWAVGIPGTLGGGLVGNAGAYGGCLADVTRQVRLLYVDGSEGWVAADDLDYGYRSSRLKKAPPDERPVVLEAVLQLQPGDAEQLRARAQAYNEQRRQRTPTGRCAGSAFMRTLQYPAGFLIEQAGLKGFRLGGAEVSAVHANFLMNEGHATAAEVCALMAHVQAVVWSQFGQRLEPEIELVGDWGAETGLATGRLMRRSQRER